MRVMRRRWVTENDVSEEKVKEILFENKIEMH